MKLLNFAFSIATANIYSSVLQNTVPNLIHSISDVWGSLSGRERNLYCKRNIWPGGIRPVWCSQTTRGKGQPVNDLDQACKDLHHGYNCIKIDDSECNPRTLDASQNEYTLPLTAISPLVDPDQACQDANPGDTCGYRTCLVEAQFLITTYQPVYAGNQTWIDMWNDMTFVHQPDGGFDFENQCIGRPGIGPAGDKQCCGQYPYRNAYFTARKQCCNDVISPIGAC